MGDKVEKKTRTEDAAQPVTQAVRLVFPVIVDPKPKALVVHCSDVRFRRAFRNFIEGDVAKGCLGLKEEDYVSLVIPGGVSSFSAALELPKQFKVAKDQVELLINHFSTIDRVVLFNHEDCAAYKALHEQLGGAFLRNLGSLVSRQQWDLKTMAKAFFSFDIPKRVNVAIYMAKFANAEHTQVTMEEIKIN
jgi:hypothetical protein